MVTYQSPSKPPVQFLGSTIGNKHGFNGVIHEFSPNRKITRTFEMENTPFGVQLEFLEFEQLTGETSKLIMHVVYRSVAHRDQLLQLPFAQGINMAYNRLEEIVSKSNNLPKSV
jgi:uncharacterized protein YndB with AHSA1/START domain